MEIAVQEQQDREIARLENEIRFLRSELKDTLMHIYAPFFTTKEKESDWACQWCIRSYKILHYAFRSDYHKEPGKKRCIQVSQ